MVTTTRSASKRLGAEADTDIRAAQSSHQKRARRAGDSSTSRAVQEQPNSRCRLLELPPELRNRIYDFTIDSYSFEQGVSEGSDSEERVRPTYAPHLRRSKPAALKWASRPWQFFGLTQTCRQLRAEHRPIWISSLSVQLDFGQIGHFATDFLSRATPQQNGPRLIQICWDEQNKSTWTDILPWLQLHAHFSGTDIEFIPAPLAKGYLPGEVTCDYCSEMQEQGRCHCCYDYEYGEGQCECDDPQMEYHDWVSLNEDRISYLSIVTSFLRNDNKDWLDATRGQLVKCTFTHDTESCVVFKVYCKQAFGTTVGDVQGAWNVLNAWGVFDLPHSANMGFVLVFEEKSTTTIRGRSVTNSVRRELRVSLSTAST